MTEQEESMAKQPQQSTAIEPVQGDDEFLASLDRRNKLMDRILAYAIGATHPTQWMDMGGKPYPTGPACEAMARRCAVSWVDVESEREDREDEFGSYYIWTYRGRFSLPGGRDVIHAEGHFSSRQQFLGSAPVLDDEGREKERKREEWEVDEGKIRQSAFTNMVNNGVTRILGIRNLTWERLCQLLGVPRDQFGKVEFGAGARGGGRQHSSDDVEIKWGNAKGKKLSELSDDDVKYYLGAWQRDLADPEKAKYHASCKRNIEIAQKLLASRANQAAGTTSPANNQASQPPSIWARIRALPEAQGLSDKTLGEEVRKATGKESRGQLVEADIAKVQAALKKGDEDIRF